MKEEDITELLINTNNIKECLYTAPEAFKRILIKTPFEEWCDEIYSYLVVIKDTEFDYDDWYNQNWYNQIDVCNNLLILKESNDIEIRSPKGKSNLSPSMIDMLIQELEKEYKRLELDWIPMSEKEAKKQLNQSSANSWKDKYWGRHQEESNLVPQENTHRFDYNYIDTSMIWSYIYDNRIIEEITPLNIKNAIKRLECKLESKKRGAPTKNLRLHAALQVFVERGLQNKNNDLRIAFECLNYFNMIDETIIKGWADTNKYPEIQYMKSLYREKDKYALSEFPF